MKYKNKVSVARVVAALKRRWNAGFVKAARILVGGTVVAQLIKLMALPLLTRLYTPEQFNLLAVYVAVVTILASIATFRFDAAIPLPEDARDAISLLILAGGAIAVTTLLVSAAVYLAPTTISSVLQQPDMRPYLWLIPLGVFCVSLYGALQFWASREGEFALIAETRIAQAVGGTATQISTGLLLPGPAGLLVGQVIGSAAGIVRILRQITRYPGSIYAAIQPRALLKVSQSYSRFPKYASFEALANSLAIQLPVVMIAAAALGPEAGYLMLAMRVMQAPLSLIGNAVSQVYYPKAAASHRAGALASLTERTISGLASLGVGPILFAAMIGPSAFAIVFGEEWARAGELVRWMAPWIILQFVVSPVSMSLQATDHQRLALLLQLSSLGLRIGIVALAYIFLPEQIAIAYALSGFLVYATYLVVVGHVVGLSVLKLTRALMSSLTLASVWLLAGWITIHGVAPFASDWLVK